MKSRSGLALVRLLSLALGSFIFFAVQPAHAQNDVTFSTVATNAYGAGDVGGVGYLVWCSGRTLSAIGDVGGDVTLYTEMQVREDAITLYGFGSAGERDAYRLLTSVQGVGGRLALAILTVLDAGELSKAIASGDIPVDMLDLMVNRRATGDPTKTGKAQPTARKRGLIKERRPDGDRFIFRRVLTWC